MLVHAVSQLQGNLGFRDPLNSVNGSDFLGACFDARRPNKITGNFGNCTALDRGRDEGMVLASRKKDSFGV
jgi:hypothetical protein